jgi:sugar diacid utilization regulator
VLLVEVLEGAAHVSMVRKVKSALRHVVRTLGAPDTVVGISAVTRVDALPQAYREAREMVRCVDEFGGTGDRVVALDDLGPVRLLIANEDADVVLRYARSVLGPLVAGREDTITLLRTMQAYFDAGRSIRESSHRLGVHENTVRLRLSKASDLTGLNLATNSNDQMCAQTALLVLRLAGHDVRTAQEPPETPTSK